MIPAAITHLQESFFRTANTDGDVLESTSTHPCHRLSIPAARLFWCRHCMQIFEDPITRWRHSKTCLQSSSGKVRKDKDGSTMQVFLSANNLSELRREQNRSRAISRSAGPGHSPGTDLRCFICKTTFVSIDEMRVHVRNPCRKRPKIAAPKNKLVALPAEVKTEIQIPNTASEIIYIKDGHQTVISLESPYATEMIEPVPETQIPDVETVVPVAPKNDEVVQLPEDQTENKENNVRKRKRILPKEVDDRPNHKMSNSPKSEQQIALSLPTKPEDVKDILDDFEVPPIKISKMTNKEPEDETSQTKVRAKPLQIKEEFSQLLTPEKKDNQSFLGGEHLPNGVVTEQVIDEAVLLKAPASPDEKIVTGAAAEAKLKDLFTTMEMRNKTKLPPSPKQTKIVSSPRKSPFKTGSPMKIRNDDIDKCQNDNLVKEERHSCISQEESIDTSGLLLYMPPINAGSVTLPDPLLDLRSGLPAEMLLDETTNTKPPIPVVPEAINAIIPSDITEEIKLPSHIFDGDLLPSQIHSEVLFEEITDEKENPPLVDNRLVGEFVSAETNLEDVVKIVLPVGINEMGGEIEKFVPVGQVFSVEEVVSTEVVTPVKENTQIFASIEEIPLPVTIDHIEEIAHSQIVAPIEEIHLNAPVVPIKEIVPPVEEVTPLETIAPVQQTNSIETIPSVPEASPIKTIPSIPEASPVKTIPSIPEASPVKTVTPVLETTPIEIVSPTKETIPMETLASVVGATKIESVPPAEGTANIEVVSPVQEPTSKEAVPSVQEPTPVVAVLSIQEPTAVKTASLVPEPTPSVAIPPVQEATATVTVIPVLEPTPTDAVLPVIENLPIETVPPVKDTTPIEIDTADKDIKFVKETSPLKAVEDNQEIPLEESELKLGNNEKSVLPIPESLKILNQAVEPDPVEKNAEMKTKDEANEENQANVAEQTKTEARNKPAKLFKCKACSNVFKTSQALQKHSRVPCILKHTRSLSQKILRPKQPCLKIEKKPLKKKLAKPSRRPKFMIPIIPITRPELIRPAVPKRPKRFSRRKKRRSFFIDEQNRILPYVNVLMSELSDKDRFFYKLGMINQCRKIPSSETTTTTAPDAEAPAVETLGDSAVDSLSGVKTDSTYPPEITLLSVVAAEPQGIAYSASPVVAAACVSDKENLSALAKGLCLSLPTLEKMEDTQFHDPNCIPPSHVKPDPDDPPRGPSGATGPSVQSTCWEAAPRLAQLPGVTQIVRVTSADLSSADLLNGINATNESSVIPESDQSNVLANSKSLSFSDSNLHCKTQSKKISKDMVNSSDLDISCHRAAKNPACEELNSKEPLGNVFENGASVSTQELGIKELSGSNAAQKDNKNLPENGVNRKIRPNSVPKEKVRKTKDGKKASVETKKQSKKGRVVSPDKTNRSRSSVDKNSPKSKLNHSQTAKHEVIESVNPTKNHNRINDRNQKQTDSCTGANIETGKRRPRSVDSTTSNPQKRITSSSSKKVTSKQNSAVSSSPCKKVASNQKSPVTTPTSSQKVPPNQKSPMTGPTSSKKGGSNQKSPMTSPCSSKKGGSSQKSPMTTPTSSKKVPSNQKSSVTTPTACKKGGSRKESPMRSPSSKKGGSSKESSIATPNSSKKGISAKESLIATPTSCKKIASNQKSAMAKQQSVSSRKHIQPQQKIRGKEEKKLRSVQMKPASNLTISTRSSPLKKTMCKQALELLNHQKSVGSLIKMKKKATTSRRQDDRICKPGSGSLKGKAASKSLQIKQRNSSRISNISHQNFKKVIPNGETLTRNCEVTLSKFHSTEILYSLSEKSSASRDDSSPKEETKQGSKGQKPAKPFSETSDAASPSRVTRRTQKLDNSLTDSKGVQKVTTAASKRNYKSLPESKGSNSSKNNLKVPQDISQPIKDWLDHGERDSSQERRLSKKPGVSENQSQISLANLASPTSETKHRKNKSPIEKSPSRNKQRFDSPSRLSSTNDHSNSASIPYLRTRSISKGDISGVKIDSAKNDIAPLSNQLISKPLANATYTISSRSKSKLCSELITHSTSVDKEVVFDKNISSSSTYHKSESDLPAENNSRCLSESVSKECNENNQDKREVKNILGLKRDSEDSRISPEFGSSNVSQIAEIPTVPCIELDNQEFGDKQSVKMIASLDKSVLVNGKLKHDFNPSLISGECHSESRVTELPSGKSLLNSGSGDPCKTEATAVVTVTNTAVTTESSFSVNNDIVTNSCHVDYETPSQNSETPLNVSTTATLNPRVSIATQTDSSFLKETKTGSGVPSGSCDNMEKNEAPSSPVSFHPDPPLPLPSSPTTDSTPTPVDNPLPPTVLSEDERCEVVQENLDPSVLPSPQEIIINDTPLPSVSPSPPGTMCEPVQGDSGLQEENTDASVLLPQPVPEPSSNIAIEPPLQQLVLDNATDPNVLVQYLNSLDTSMLPQEVTFVIIQGTPGEPLQLTDDHNFIIEQTAFSEHAEQESANSSVIYTLQPPQSDITTETECIMTDSS